ncbi:MAG: NAD(P)/FAD-dependent oxidoreductase [Actinobacteria bacterium]|nr:NAD(P)/FAD-dependent oxidoreductase [Actinomycetota bacterium]
MAASSSNGDRSPISVGIVGGGFGGLGMAVRLQQAGIEDFTIFERAEEVGGVWRANTYPGAACDVPSHLYSFSFAPGHEWSRRYAPQAEIQAYIQGVMRDFGLEPHLRLGIEADSASFDEPTGRWTLATADGESHEFDVLITACGQLTNPQVPAIPGRDSFEAPAFHSAEWDHDCDLSGKDVAVIGTGASAIQFVPAIAPEVRSLTIYQRSAPWIAPKNDRAYSEAERELFRRFPARVAAARYATWAFHELATRAFTGTEWMAESFERLCDHYRRAALSDPDLIERTTPDYELGCKRVLITSDWYPTLERDNVELISGQVQRITEAGVVGPDGVERPADVIVWGTGFSTHDFVAPMRIEGLGGCELNEVWAERPEAYLGITVAGFPNLFVIYGPNTNHGAGSVPFTLECQMRYILDGIRRLREQGLRYIDLRPEVQARWREEIERRSQRTRWVRGGGSSWYVTEAGINTNNWPGPWLEYRRRTHRLNPGDYRAARRAAPAPADVAAGTAAA